MQRNRDNSGSLAITPVLREQPAVKYFFLAEGWQIGRVWEFGGLWNETVWRRKPDIRRCSLCLVEQGERLWLYQVEEAILMLEVVPTADNHDGIGQVVLKRLISSEQVIEHLQAADAIHTLAELERAQAASNVSGLL
jgi:hypothetical protein